MLPVPIPIDLPPLPKVPELPKVVVATSAPTAAAPASHGGTHIVLPPLEELRLPPVPVIQRPTRRVPDSPLPPPVARPPAAVQRPSDGPRVPQQRPPTRQSGPRVTVPADASQTGELALTGAEGYGAAAGLVLLAAASVLWRWTCRAF